MKYYYLVLKTIVCFFGVVVPSWSQTSPLISGKVVDQNDIPIPEVTVTSSVNANKSATDFNGNFSIDTPINSQLTFLAYGFKEQSITITSKEEIVIKLIATNSTFEEVVVTALNIPKEKKQLGYASQKIDGTVIEATRNENPLNALAGKVAGLQVSNASGNLGGSTRILLRGPGSITQNNQPLLVIDGIPFDNSNFNDIITQEGSGGRDFGDTGFDIPTNDIKDINVLKGGAAAALYGSRANNGVILITTKKATSKKLSIEINSGINFTELNVTPQFQTQYGGGNTDTFGTEIIDGQEFEVVDYANDVSWGPRYDANRNVLHWDNVDPEFPNEYLQARPWVYPENDVFSFFRTAKTLNNNIAISQAYDKGNFRFSLGHIEQEGIFPNSKLDKTNVGLKGSLKITKKLTLNAGINFTRTNGFNRPTSGYDTENSLLVRMLLFSHTQLDYSRLRNYLYPDGTQRTWNRVSAFDRSPQFYDNPFWTVFENTAEDTRKRWFGNINLNYEFDEHWAINAKLYSDTYTTDIDNRIALGSVSLSRYQERKEEFEEYNYEANINYKTTLKDLFKVNAFVGVNRRDVTRTSNFATTLGGLQAPNIYTLENGVEGFSRDQPIESPEVINSVFGGVTLGYNDFLFLDLTGRNDWSSTLPTDNNSYFYPSASTSFIFSKLLNAPWISFGKLRLATALVGNATEPFRTQNTFRRSNDFLGTPRFSVPSQNSNPFLKPEEKTSYEVGLEMSFLKNVIGFDLTYYEEITENLITPLGVDGSSGFISQIANTGRLSNKGIEAIVNFKPIDTKDFTYNLTWNFSKNTNKLEKLNDQVKSHNLGFLPFDVLLTAEEGLSYGQIRGTNFVFDNQGNKVVGEDGNYLATQNFENLGSILPDYNMSFINSIRYKNLNLRTQIDVQEGGHYRSLTHEFGRNGGLLEETAANGIRENGLIVDGVQGDVTFNNDGTYTVTNTRQNTTRVSARSYNENFFNGPKAQNVFRSDYVKLREVSISYDFPIKNKLPFNGIQFSIYGRNLLTWGLDNKHVDPEVASTGSGNIQGSEGGSIPSTRTYGANLKIQF